MLLASGRFYNTVRWAWWCSGLATMTSDRVGKVREQSLRGYIGAELTEAIFARLQSQKSQV